jgi:hypothetical protein
MMKRIVPVNGAFGGGTSNCAQGSGGRGQSSIESNEGSAPETAERHTQGWGFIDRNGTIIIPPQFRSASSFSEGFAYVNIDGKAGYINKEGVVVFYLPTIDFPSDFSESLAVQISEGLFGAIDRSGTWVISPKFIELSNFSEGLALAMMKEREKLGFINKKGEWVIPPQFEQADSFSEGLAPVRLEKGKWGYIDSSGVVAIAPRFESASQFREGLALVDDSDFIDKEGQVVIQSRLGFYPFGDFSQGRTPFFTNPPGLEDRGKVGFMDPTGEIVIPAIFHRAPTSFSEGLAAVELTPGKWGVIDLSGKMVVQPFDEVSPFSEGLAAFNNKSFNKWDGLYGFIDKTGKTVIRAQFVYARPFSEGLACVSFPSK